MAKISLAAILAILLSVPLAGAQAGRSAYDIGYRRALGHGYGEIQGICLGNLYSQHASLNSHGHYSISGGKGRRGPFRELAWQHCGISL